MIDTITYETEHIIKKILKMMGTVTKWMDDFMKEVSRNDRQHNNRDSILKVCILEVGTSSTTQLNVSPNDWKKDGVVS